MSRWMKVAAVALAAMVGLVPAFAQLSYAQALPELVPVLPVGEELPAEELMEAEGEFWWFWIVAIAVAGVLSVYHQWFDGEPGITREDIRSIARISLAAGLAAHWAWAAWGFVDAIFR